jgi:hypothetical protein
MSTTVSVYIAETSPAHLRGRLVAFQSVLITMGRFCGALASAVAFTLYPPVTGRKEPVLMMTTDLLTSTKAAGGAHHSHQWPFRLQWLDVLNFSSRRSVRPSVPPHIDRCVCCVSLSPSCALLYTFRPSFDVYRWASRFLLLLLMFAQHTRKAPPFFPSMHSRNPRPLLLLWVGSTLSKKLLESLSLSLELLLSAVVHAIRSTALLSSP